MIRAVQIAAIIVAAALIQTAPAKSVDIVSVTGCLREASAGEWLLVNATDPVPSSANAPPKNEIPTTPPVGRSQFRLIGVSEFNMPQHKDHVVIVKGLHIQAQPISRLNITSVTTISVSCPAGK